MIGKIILNCEKNVAYNSPDYIMPLGTIRDNSTNRLFNNKLYLLYPNLKNIKILDLGCSGGGFVKSCVDDGHFAIGLEGSDYSKKFKRAEWRTIPQHLFTCDITGNFDLFLKDKNKKERLLFNAVTAWEVIEHISEKDLKNVSDNIKKHFAKNAVWIMSVSPNEDKEGGFERHQTIKPKKWWINKFNELGWIHNERYVKYFNTQFVRGPKYNAPDSFHLILTLPNNGAPRIPNERFVMRLYEKWVGSKLQRILKKGITGEI